MSNRESWKTWAAVAALLIFAGVASAVVPFLLDQADGSDSSTEVASEPLATTIDVSQLPFIGEVLVEIPFIADNVQGQPITALQAFGIAFGVVLVSVGALGLLITIVTVLFDRLVNRVYGDESYQEVTAQLQQREIARVKEIQQEKPPTVGPDKKVRSRWSMGIYAFIFLLFVWIVGLTLGTVYFGDTEVEILGASMSAATLLNLVLVVLTIVILYLALRRRDPEDLENPESDHYPIDWGYVWIVVSGILIVGIGAGAAMATRGGG